MCYKGIMKKNLSVILLCLCCAFLSAQNEPEAESDSKVQKDFQNNILTMAGFQSLQTAEKDFVFTPSVNLQYMRMKNEGVISSQPDFLVIGAGYSLDHFTKGLGPDKVDNLHNCNLMSNFGWGKNSFTAMVASGGEVPFSSIHNITGGLMYSREFISTDKLSFAFGGGIMAGDFGLSIGDFNIYVLPLPILSFSYQNDYVAAGIAMMGLPAVQLILFPKSMFRFNGSCSLSGFDSIRDLTFDCALACYPLINTKAKDFLSVSAGVMNTSSSHKLKDNTAYGYQYYTAYGEINATFVTFRCGYNFDGKVLVDSKPVADMYKGVFASVQAMFMF